MTILDELFSEAEGLWNSIQGTADSTQQVVVDVAMVSIFVSNLKVSLDQPNVLPGDTLVYQAGRRVLNSPATFVGSTLTIIGPNFHIIPAQPSYQVQWVGLPPHVPIVDDSLYFYVKGVGGYGGGPLIVVFTLSNLRLEAP